MALGDSAGRSAGSRTGEGATRRATPSERAQRVPPRDDMEHVHVPEVEAMDVRWILRGLMLIGVVLIVVGALLNGGWLIVSAIGLLLQVASLASYDARFVAEPRLKRGRRIAP